MQSAALVRDVIRYGYTHQVSCPGVRRPAIASSSSCDGTVAYPLPGRQWGREGVWNDGRELAQFLVTWGETVFERNLPGNRR